LQNPYNLMNTINEIVFELSKSLTNTKIQVLCQICKSIFIATGKITMLEISRTTQRTYRTIQRFFALKNLAWSNFNMLIFKKHIEKQDDVFLLAGDETVEKKSGKNTYGISRFFSNIFKQTVPSVAFMVLSIISYKRRKSYPIGVEQIIKKQKEKKEEDLLPKKFKEKKEKKAVGRPKGSKNNKKKESKDIQYDVLKNLLTNVCTLLGNTTIAYLLLDGYFANQYYIRLANNFKLNLISKLRNTTSLYFPYNGIQKSRGKRKKYGNKIDVENLSKKYLQKREIKDDCELEYYQLLAWNKNITDFQLNVVIIRAISKKSKKVGYCYLFTTDLNLSYDKIVDYYTLRFQIEFNFRDAKQYFGLADFKNYKETQVTNAVNISFFMCNIAYILSEKFKEYFEIENVSILDMKAYYRTEMIGNEAIKLKIEGKKSHQFLKPEDIFKLSKYQAVNF